VTFRVTGTDRQAVLAQLLEDSGAERAEARGSGEVWRYRAGGASVTLWRTGTVRVQGKGEHLEELLALVREHAVQAGGDPATPVSGMPVDLPRDRPWIGCDESGKGDYFGPLVSAAVYVEPADADRLRELGVQDSKKLTDKRVHALAPQIRELSRQAITMVAPPRYNELYADFRRRGKSLNHLLAWEHTRSIEDLVEAGLDPAYAIVDQFAADPSVIERAVLAETRARELRVVQFPRAEADVAVAAASILAREAFVTWVDRASERIGVHLPKGASPAVIAAAREVVERGGEAALASVAKLHFGTTAQVLAG
jgi:ribonuclease HIII